MYRAIHTCQWNGVLFNEADGPNEVECSGHYNVWKNFTITRENMDIAFLRSPNYEDWSI
jgi:hypothetical protein